MGELKLLVIIFSVESQSTWVLEVRSSGFESCLCRLQFWKFAKNISLPAVLVYFLKFLFIYLNFIYLFIYGLCWVFVSVRGLSLVAASGGQSSLRCVGLSLSRPLLLRSTGSRRAGSVIVAHGPSHSAARGIFPDQGSNPCPLHWQADSQPLHHQGSPVLVYFKVGLIIFTYKVLRINEIACENEL